METNAGWLFTTQSKCAPSMVFRRVLSANIDIINVYVIVSLFHTHFLTNRQSASLNTNELGIMYNIPDHQHP